jgi:hypothetical protein
MGCGVMIADFELALEEVERVRFLRQLGLRIPVDAIDKGITRRESLARFL